MLMTGVRREERHVYLIPGQNGLAVVDQAIRAAPKDSMPAHVKGQY